MPIHKSRLPAISRPRACTVYPVMASSKVFTRSEGREHAEPAPLYARAVERSISPDEPRCEPDDSLAALAFGGGLLEYEKWWFRRAEVGVSVNGDMLVGTPIFLRGHTLRMVDEEYSYFIPLSKVDYIRTADGLRCGLGNAKRGLSTPESRPFGRPR